MTSALIRHLFTDNAMLEETRRIWRKHVAGNTRRDVVGNYAAAAIVALAYLWGMTSLSQNMAIDWTIEIEYIELFLLTLIIPASIYGAIAGEREKATWEALILTRLTPEQIITGKVVPRTLIIALILGLLSFPIELSQSHASRGLPGSHPSNFAVLSGQSMLIAWAFLLIAFGLWVSANSRRSVNAAGTLFGLLLFSLALLPMLVGTFTSGIGLRDSDLIEISVCFNPYVILAALQQSAGNSYNADWFSRVQWYGPLVGWYATAFYLAVAAVFLTLTHRCLKRLEEPQRRSG